MKGLTRKVAAVLLAVTMIIPAGASVPAMAAQDADAEAQVQSVTIAVQNTGGSLTVTDESGTKYVLDASKKKQTIEVPVGSKLKTTAAAEDGYDVATYTITTDSGTEEVEITDKSKLSHDVEVTEELRTIRTSFAESEAEDEEEVEEDYGVSQGTLKLDIGSHGSVEIGGTTYPAGSTNSFTYDAGTSVTATVKADAGYEIDSVIVKDVTNNRNLYRVVDFDSSTSHKITFKVFGDRTEQLIVTFDVEETEDPFAGADGALTFHSVEDSSLTKMNSNRIYKSQNGDLAYCGDASKHGPGEGVYMKLVTDSSYQTAMDYIMYYGYPNHTTINGRAYSAKDAHDLTQIAVWFVIDPEYSGPTWRKTSETTKARVKEFVAKAFAYDGKDDKINGSALIYFPSSDKKQPMVIPNTNVKPATGNISIQKVSTDPSVTDGNVEYSFAGATYTVKAAEDIGSSYDKGETVTTLKTDDAGTATSKDLPLGKYTVTETKVPVTYEKDSTVHDVTLKEGNTSENIEVVKSNEKPKMGHIILNKTSDHPEYSDGNKYYPLANAVYTVYAAEAIGTKYQPGDEVTTIKTDDKGYGKSVEIPFGKYTVKETTVPREFQKDEVEHPVHLSALNNPATIDVTVKSEEPIRWGYIELNKVSALPKITDGKAEHAILRMANDQYRKTIFNAQVYANTGAGTYEKAVDMATKSMRQAGLNCVVYANGARHTLRDYADMAIRTANTRAYLAGEAEMREDWGIHTVIVNKRSAACPRCMPFVGKVLIDDVYGNGSKKDGKYPLLSSAIAKGFLHPRCKDVYTTYFPELEEDEETALSSLEKKELVERDLQIEKEKFAERQAERFGRMARHSLDPENKQKYEARAEEWEEKAEKLRPVEDPDLETAAEERIGHDASLDPEHTKSPFVDASKLISPERQKEIDEALEYYVSGEGMFVNEHLAGTLEKNGGIWTEEDEELLKLLDEGTKGIVKQKKLWRSVDASAVFGDISPSEFYDLQDYVLYGESSVTPDKAARIKKQLALEGKEITEPRLMSTTTDKQLALEWRDFTGSDKPIVLEFDVPEGIHGEDLKRFDLPDDSQNEVLLARGQKYRIRSIGSEEGQIVVKAELLPEAEEEIEAGRLARKAQQEAEKQNLRDMLRDSVTIGKPYMEPEVIKSSEFSSKFSRITNDSSVNDRIRKSAKGVLTKNNGTYTETLHIIDADTGDLIFQKQGKKNALEVVLTKEERQMIREYQGRKIAIHNHPTNIFPTGSDFVTASARGYDFGLVVTHDGRVFKYTGPKEKVRVQTLDEIIEYHTKMCYTDDDKVRGFERAMEEIERRFGITWKEIK